LLVGYLDLRRSKAVGEVYEQFVHELAKWRHKYHNRPRAEIIRLLMLALEREAIVAVAYRDYMLARRIRAMPLPDDVKDLVRHAMIWAWKDEEMHAIYLRGMIYKLGTFSLRLRAFYRQLSGIAGGWAGSVQQHLRWPAAPVTRSLATLITWAGVVTGQVPPEVVKYLRHGSFREFCLFNVDAEKTAWMAYQRLLELMPGQSTPEQIGDVQRIQDDEERHTRLFAILAASVDEQDRLVSGVTAERLTAQISELGEVFLPRSQRSGLVAANPTGSGGPVWVVCGDTAEQKNALFQHLLDKSGLSQRLVARADAVGKTIQDLRVAIKPTFMLGYHHRDLSPVSDPVLVKQLVGYIHDCGCQDIAIVEAANLYDHFYQNRSVSNVAQYFGIASPHARVIDLTSEQTPYAYYRGLAQYSVGQTWRDADFRISFGKLRSHPTDMVYLSMGNLEGMGARCDEFFFSERQSHRDTAIMMLLSDFPVHYALLDGYDTAPDGLLGMMGAPHPKTPRRLYAGGDILAIDIVAARHLGFSDPYQATLLRAACYWFGDPSRQITVLGPDEPIPNWRNPYQNEWTTLLSLLAHPVYEFGSGRGALFVPEMDTSAFPPITPESVSLRIARRLIQTMLGIRW
jgi:uncharacterized protein (DUF362 family)